MESFVLDATCALMLWDQGHRRGTTCARERTEWGHFCGCAAGAAQQPLCQAAKTQVGNKVKSRDQHLPGALSGQAFPLRKRAAKDAVSKDPNSLVQIRAPLAATSSSSVLLEPENNTGRKGAPSSTVAARSSSSAVQTCSPPATPPARSHRCWELLTRKQDQCWMAQGVCLLLQEWEQLSSVKSDKLHWTIGGAPAPEKVCACVHSCSPNLSWGRELGWTEVALPGAGPARAHGGKNHRS